jgi:lysophospholipase L1-like esterase
VAVVALALAALTACNDSSALSTEPTEPPPSPATSAQEELSYVALGDSFTAAPYVPRTDLADGCLRSSGNYPSLVAEELGARLTDVSCSGADTGDITGRQRVGFGGSTVRPQIKAVRPGTDLVTVGIGGNDENLFATLVYRCTGLADQPGTPCADALTTMYGDPAAVVAGTGDRVAATLRTVARQAPDATVVLVGYPRLVSEDEGCSRFPLAEGDRPLLVAFEEELNRSLAAAARRTGAGFVDLRAVSEGHEICSADPWVNGARTDQTRALAFHPFAEGQQAAAEAVLELADLG